jgi:glycosyltransferase involved in cell wall biosynthesis
MYTAQNVDKRYPPPFTQYEREAHRRVAGLYPCSAQAASVARGKGFAGIIDVLPLGYDDALFTPGEQSVDDDEIVLALFGRLQPEKGVTDAVRILARLNAIRAARLVVYGTGPEEGPARTLATSLGVADRLELAPWLPTAELAAIYRRAHVVLVPSRPTETWVEQFGRVIVEGQASGAVVAGYASGSIPEVAGEAAVLTEVGAVSELGDRIVALLADAADFARRREQGIALSGTRTWARVAQRQAELYHRVLSGDEPRLHLPRSPRKRRAAARDEFGATASTTGGTRPFALPVLRRPGAVPSALGAALDAAAELAARLPARRA